ncbi:MAG: DNA repair protein RecO [Chlamydiales bacterium]|nr:DNA repair protein RecO [Chlamydiales bacterium]
MEEKVEGIVLRAVPFKDQDRILTLYTPEQGVMSLYVRGLSKKKPTLTNLATPLCRGEYLFRKGRADLHKFLDGSIVDLHLALRKSYRHLEVAGKILTTIYETQLPGKSSPALYALLASFLKKLGSATYPETLSASFHLKFLKHEGLLDLENLNSKLLLTLVNTRQFEPLLDLELPAPIIKEVDVLLSTQL